MFRDKYIKQAGLFLIVTGGVVASIAVVFLLWSGRIFTNSGFRAALSLKAITYHYLNGADRSIAAPDLLASKIFVYLLAALCVTGAGVSIRLDSGTMKPCLAGYLFLLPLLLLFIFLYAEYAAIYTPG